MAFCPTCGAEYRAGLIRCPDCEVALVEELQEIRVEDEEPLELLKKCGPTEAAMIEELLRNNGIETTLQGQVAAATLPATGELDEVRIWVKRKDAGQALELLEALFTPVKEDKVMEDQEDTPAGDEEEPEESAP